MHDDTRLLKDDLEAEARVPLNDIYLFLYLGLQ